MSLIINNLSIEQLLETRSFRTEANVQATSNSVLQLSASSQLVHIFTGNTSGQSVKMPDATTLSVGHRFEIYNEASVQIAIKDYADNSLITLQQDQGTVFILQSNANASGVWVFHSVSQSLVGSGEFLVTNPAGLGNPGLTVNYTGGQANFNGVLTDVAPGSLNLPDNTSGYIYVDVDATVKYGTSLPPNVMVLAEFTTASGAITVLQDQREFVEQNLVWGNVTDISDVTSQQAAQAGSVERYARADHVHYANFLKSKAGIVAYTEFSGTPRKATVTFTNAFSSNNYTVTVVGEDARIWTVESKATTGFTINSNANTALTGNVFWKAAMTGESD